MKHPKSKQIRIADGSSIDLLLVEGGDFLMGSENGRASEKPVHELQVGSFYMGKYQVTQSQWQETMGTNPSVDKGENRRWRPLVGMRRKNSSRS